MSPAPRRGGTPNEDLNAEGFSGRSHTGSPDWAAIPAESTALARSATAWITTGTEASNVFAKARWSRSLEMPSAAPSGLQSVLGPS